MTWERVFVAAVALLFSGVISFAVIWGRDPKTTPAKIVVAVVFTLLFATIIYVGITYP